MNELKLSFFGSLRERSVHKGVALSCGILNSSTQAFRQSYGQCFRYRLPLFELLDGKSAAKNAMLYPEAYAAFQMHIVGCPQ